VLLIGDNFAKYRQMNYIHKFENIVVLNQDISYGTNNERKYVAKKVTGCITYHHMTLRTRYEPFCKDNVHMSYVCI
jgi:hypothetical protein